MNYPLIMIIFWGSFQLAKTDYNFSRKCAFMNSIKIKFFLTFFWPHQPHIFMAVWWMNSNHSSGCFSKMSVDYYQLHGITTQKIILFIVTALRTPNPTQNVFWYQGPHIDFKNPNWGKMYNILWVSNSQKSRLIKTCFEVVRWI